jgi:hypothetical protein
MVDQEVQSPIHACSCDLCRQQPLGQTGQDPQAINRVLASLNERQRRLFAGMLAQCRGHGGILLVAQITGLSRTTIRRGIEELRSGVGLDENRIREKGGGRKRVEKKRPQ